MKLKPAPCKYNGDKDCGEIPISINVVPPSVDVTLENLTRGSVVCPGCLLVPHVIIPRRVDCPEAPNGSRRNFLSCVMWSCLAHHCRRIIAATPEGFCLSRHFLWFFSTTSLVTILGAVKAHGPGDCSRDPLFRLVNKSATDFLAS